MRIDDITQASLLYDFYGQLLSTRQREVMELYHEENLTLSEIADEFGITRQGVHDALKNAEKSLNGYETKLGLVAKFQRSTDAVHEIDSIIDDVISSLNNDEACIRQPDSDSQDDVKHIGDEENCSYCKTGMSHEDVSVSSKEVIAKLKKVKDIIDNLEE